MPNELDDEAEAIISYLPEDLHFEWLDSLAEIGLWDGKSKAERTREEQQLTTDYWGAIHAVMRNLLTRRHAAAQAATKH